MNCTGRFYGLNAYVLPAIVFYLEKVEIDLLPRVVL